MAKKIIKSAMQRLNMIPDKEKIAQNKSLKFLGDKLHQPHLWHINRHSVARAFAVGGFAMYTPPLPWQMVIAAVLAVYFEANLPISVALVWITNPLTWIPLYYIAYSLGAMLTGQKGYSFDDFSTVFSSLGDAWEKLGAPFLLGCFGMMILCAVAGYFGIQFFWRYHVMKAWEKRKMRRREAVRRAFEGLPEEVELETESIFTRLENAWNNVGKPFVANSLEIAAMIGNAGVDGLQSFWSEAVSDWKQYRAVKQQQAAAASSTITEEQPAPAEQPNDLLKTLHDLWETQGKPLALDAYQILRIVIAAGRTGILAFWHNAARTLVQRKTESQKTGTDQESGADGVEFNTTEPQTNNP